MSEDNEQQQSPAPTPNPSETAPSAPSPDPVSDTAPASLLGGESAPENETTDESPAPAPLTVEDITLPEGFEAPPELLEEFVGAMNDAEATPAERANALIGLQQKLLENTAAEMQEQWNTTQEEWRNATQALPEIGGQNLDQTLGSIAQVVNRYGGNEARAAFDLTGAGNHPALIKMMAAIAKDLNEKPPVSGVPSTGDPKSRAERMFG